jgi:hypothetical protein
MYSIPYHFIIPFLLKFHLSYFSIFFFICNTFSVLGTGMAQQAYVTTKLHGVTSQKIVSSQQQLWDPQISQTET